MATVAFAQGTAGRDEAVADRLYYDKQYEPALKIYESLLQTDNKNTYLLEQAGLCLYRLERYQKAKEKLRLATLYCPVGDKEKMALYYTNLSACYAHLDDYSRAYEYAVKAYNMDQTSEVKLWNAASHAQNLGRYADALRIMDQAVISKNNAFQTLYGRCYLGTGRYTESIEHYEDYFKNDKGNDDLAAIDRKMEQRNLIYAYAYRVDREQMDTTRLQGMIARMGVLIAASGTDTLKERLLRLFLVTGNICRKYDYPQVMCEKLFAAITVKSTETERLWYTYYITGDYERVYAAAGRLLQAGADPGRLDLVKRLHYLACLQRFVKDYKERHRKTNQPMLDTVVILFKDLFEKGKQYSDAEMQADQEIYQGISETFTVFQQYFRSPEEQKAVAPVLLGIMQYLPNEKARRGITTILRKGVINN